MSTITLLFNFFLGTLYCIYTGALIYIRTRIQYVCKIPWCTFNPYLASSPSPFPVCLLFQYCTLNRERGLNCTWSHMYDALKRHVTRVKDCCVKLPVFKWSHYNRLYALDSFLWPARNGSVHETADLSPYMCIKPVCLSTPCVPSVRVWHGACDFTFHTASCFSACIIEKLRMCLWIS